MGTAPMRILDPLQASGLGTGWGVDPAKGALRITVADLSVPGDLPIPVVFRFNASHGQESHTVGVWTQVTTEDGRTYNTYVPMEEILDRGIFGTIHFGFITSNTAQKVPNTGSGHKDNYVPKTYYVLEDGTQYTEDDFTSFATSVGGAFNLPPYFGLAAKDPSTVLVNSDGSLATYTASLSDLGSWSAKVSALAPGVSTFTVLMDRDRARIMAKGTGGPILWLDRFGRSISFSRGTYTTGLPSGISSVGTVTALNDRGNGVQLQWAQPTAGSSAPAQILARLDYIGVQAPSIQIYGYSGVPATTPAAMAAPSLAMDPVTVGPAVRPLTVTLGNPAGLAIPAWMQLPLPSSSPFTEPWPADRTWSFTYDSAQAEVTSFSEPSGVTTNLTWQTHTLINPLFNATNNTYRCVSAASSLDGNGITFAQAWTWALPTTGAELTWVTRLSQAWSGPNVVSAGARTYQYAFSPPGDANFGNAVPSGVSILNAALYPVFSSTYTYKTVGVDSSLSALSSQTVTRTGSPTVSTSATLDSVTGLPLTATRASGNYSETLTYTYESHADLLEPKRLLTVTTQHTVGSTTTTAPVAKYEYDPASWFPKKAYADGGADGQMGTSTTYAAGRVASRSNFASAPLSTTAGVATQTITRNADSGLASQTQTTFDVASTTDTFTVNHPGYDTADRPTLTQDGLGLNTTYTYDARGRVQSLAQDGQATITYTYPTETSVTTTQNLLTTSTVFDGFGRVLTRSRGSDGVTESYTYDSNGNQASMTETNSAGVSRSWSRTCDVLGRVVASVPMTGPSVSYSYASSAGNQVVTATFTPSSGTPFTTVTQTDLWGNGTSSTDPLGTVTTSTYDALNHPLTVTVTPSGGSSQTRTFAYTGLGLLRSKTEPETATTTFTNFNASGKPQTVTQAGGRVLTYTYDGLGRTRSLTNGADNATWTYGGLKLNQASTSSNGTATTLVYGYGDYSRLVSETATLTGLGASTWSVGYGYDPIGRLIQVNYPVSNRAIHYYYDPANFGRITQILDGTSLVAAVNYDSWGNRKELTFGSGAFNRWTRTPNGLHLDSQTLAQYGVGAITRSYAYDGLNHLTRAGEWSTLVHDVLGRLTSATLSQNSGIPLASADGPLSYQHDGYGNNTSALGGAEAAINNFTAAVPFETNRMPGEAAGVVTGWSYNANGEANILGRAIGATAAQLYPTWDGLGRMTGTGTETFGYLPSGLRASLTDTQDSTRNRIYAYSSAGQLLTEFRQTGASPVSFTTRDVVYLGGQAIAEIDASGSVHELHCDHLGSPILVTGRATGQAEGWQFYGAHGETLLSTGSYVPTTGFTGHVQMDPTGLIYMRGRFYSPAWHRFLNSDQGADPLQLNQYAYCGGSPMMLTDPSGLVGSGGPRHPKLSPTDWNDGRMGGTRYIAAYGGYSGTSGSAFSNGYPGMGVNSVDMSSNPEMVAQIRAFLQSQNSSNQTNSQLLPRWEPGARWAPASTVETVVNGVVTSSNNEPGFWYMPASQTNVVAPATIYYWPPSARHTGGHIAAAIGGVYFSLQPGSALAAVIGGSGVWEQANFPSNDLPLVLQLGSNNSSPFDTNHLSTATGWTPYQLALYSCGDAVAGQLRFNGYDLPTTTWSPTSLWFYLKNQY